MPSIAYKIQLFSLFLAVFLVFAGSYVRAQEPKSMFSATGYPIPRFVSLSSDKVYMRSGPGTKYPVLWEYKRKGLPVEITMEFDVWRKIKDVDGLYHNFKTAENAEKVIKLKAFKKFSDTKDAMKSVEKLLQGKVSKTLQKFLEKNIIEKEI